MADQNSYLTIHMVTKESMMILVNDLNFLKVVSTEYRNEFAQKGFKINGTLQVRKPIPWIVEKGPGYNPTPFVEEYVDVTISEQDHCDMQFGLIEQTLNMDNYSTRYVKPRVAELANSMDYSAMQLTYWKVANSIGPGTVADPTLANTWNTYAYAKALLDQYATPVGDRTVMVSPWEQSGIVIDNKALQNPTGRIGEQWESGNMFRTLGARWYMDQNMPIHTTGPRGGTPVVNGSGQSGSTLSVRAFTAAAALRLRRGDTFTIGDTTTKVGVYGVNPRNRATIGRFQDFTVLADVFSDASGVASIPISPPLILGPDPRQTVVSLPVDAMTLNFRGAASTPYAQNLFFQKNAFTVCSVDIEMPQGEVKWSRAVDPEAGVTMQAAMQFDIRSYQNLSRVDTLYGASTLRPECCVRVWSNANVTIP